VSKKVNCPSCDMAGDPAGDDYKLVTTYHGRPVLQCFWCDSHVMLRRMGAAAVLDLNHKAIRHLRSDLDHDEMVSLLLDQEEETVPELSPSVVLLPANEPELQGAAVESPADPAESDRLVAAVQVEPSPKRKRSRKTAIDPATVVNQPEPAMLADPGVVDNAPALLEPDAGQHNTPIGTTAELVSSIPVTARALDHDSLIHMAAKVGWSYTPVRKQPEWMNFELPPPVVMGPLRTKFQGYINMMKYFRINAGTREQRRAETLARRLRLVEYRRRMFNDRMEVLNSIKSIEYKPEAV